MFGAGTMLPQIAGAALAGLLLKLHASRPHFPAHEGPYSVRRTDEPGEPFRHSDKREIATTPFPGCDTIYATFRYAVKRNGQRRALGTRALLKVRLRCVRYSAAASAAANARLGLASACAIATSLHEAGVFPRPCRPPRRPSHAALRARCFRRRSQTETTTDAAGKPVDKLTLASEYTWLTYAQVGERADAFGQGLVALAGLQPGSKMVIYADTRAEWQARHTRVWGRGRASRLSAVAAHRRRLRRKAPSVRTSRW